MMSAGHTIGGGRGVAAVFVAVGGDDVGPTTPFDVSYS